ncbi:hypothetical protein ACSBR1_000023 [Camellia fascicularis]
MAQKQKLSGGRTESITGVPFFLRQPSFLATFLLFVLILLSLLQIYFSIADVFQICLRSLLLNKGFQITEKNRKKRGRASGGARVGLRRCGGARVEDGVGRSRRKSSCAAERLYRGGFKINLHNKMKGVLEIDSDEMGLA